MLLQRLASAQRQGIVREAAGTVRLRAEDKKPPPWRTLCPELGFARHLHSGATFAKLPTAGVTLLLPGRTGHKDIMRTLLLAASFAALLPGSAAAASITVDVLALEHSSSHNINDGLLVGSVTAGDLLTISVNTDDLWSAGDLPRWSNANGINGPDLLATGSDDSGQAANVLIGRDQFGDHTQHGLTAPFGTLVGRIDTTYFVVGTFFSGPAPATGDLRLFYWDSNYADNSESVRATVRGVAPEPGTLALFGLAAFAGLRRRFTA